MKKFQKLASILCAVSMISTAAVPAFAAESTRTLPPTEAINGVPFSEGDRLVYDHHALSGNRPSYPFTLEGSEKYFRVAVYNDMTDTDHDITVYIYKQGSSSLFASLTAKPGEWTPNRVFTGESGTTYEAVVSVAEGYDPVGEISIRVSSRLFDRSLSVDE